MSNRKIYCTLDTETVGGCTTPAGFYHIGGFIHDREGNVFASFNMVVAAMFEAIRHDDYGKRNFDLYEKFVTEGIATVVDTEDTAITVISDLCDFYGVTTMTAFNSGFDFGKTKAAALIEKREFIDLYLAALQTIGTKASYIKFCRDNRLLSTSKKNIAGSVQSFHAFLTDNPAYAEEHTALEDARVEMGIFNAIIKMHKKFTQNCTFFDYDGKWKLLVPASPR